MKRKLPDSPVEILKLARSLICDDSYTATVYINKAIELLEEPDLYDLLDALNRVLAPKTFNISCDKCHNNYEYTPPEIFTATSLGMGAVKPVVQDFSPQEVTCHYCGHKQVQVFNPKEVA